MSKGTEVMTVKEAAEILGVNPQSLRCQARKDKESLGFPVTIVGCHVIIPKIPFFKYVRGE